MVERVGRGEGPRWISRGSCEEVLRSIVSVNANFPVVVAHSVARSLEKGRTHALEEPVLVFRPFHIELFQTSRGTALVLEPRQRVHVVRGDIENGCIKSHDHCAGAWREVSSSSGCGGMVQQLQGMI